MAATSSLFLSPNMHNTLMGSFTSRVNRNGTFRKPLSFRVLAVKPPSGVEMPKVEPKFIAPLFGFTRTVEIWNSRICMIGIIGTFIVELILNKGILEIIGVDVGKGSTFPCDFVFVTPMKL